MAITRDEFKDFIKNMTVLELSEVIKELEDELGVSAAAPVAVATMPGAVAEVEEQTEFDVILKSAGAKKLNVIKEVRAITGLGLKEAKEVVDGAPKTIKEAVSKDEANELKNRLEEAGAEIEVK